MSQPLEITTHTRREVVRSIWVGVVGWYALSGFCFVGHAVRVHARGTCSFFYDLVMILFLLNDFVLARYAAVLKISLGGGLYGLAGFCFVVQAVRIRTRKTR